MAVAWGTTVSIVPRKSTLKYNKDADHHHRLSDLPCRVMVLEP